MDINNIKLSDVMSVYSGKAGKCYCGCSGKHSYAKAYQDEASKDRGYKVLDKECNKGTISRVFNKVLDGIASGGRVNMCPGKEGGFVSHMSVEVNDRVYIVYVLPGVGYEG